jgi:hypothetical protein
VKDQRDGDGATLIETMVAVLVALIGVFPLGGVIFHATVVNKNQGAETTRATIYAQDKIEKLLSLDFAACAQAAGAQPSTCNTTNISSSGWTQGLLAGGPISSSSTTTAPVALVCPDVPSSSQGYVDFLDANGRQLPSGGAGSCSSVTGSSIAYVREWSVADLTAFAGGPAMKQITVAVYSALALGTGSRKPIVVLTSVRSNPN